MRSGTRMARGVLAAALVALAAAPLAAEDKPITGEVVESLLRALDAEETEREKVNPQLQAIDARIKEFEDCKRAFEAAAEASGQKLGGLAAKIAIKAKCGASNADGFYQEKQKIMEGPEKAALSSVKMKSRDYAALKDRVAGWLGGAREGFKNEELAALEKRKGELAGALHVGHHPRGHDFSSASYYYCVIKELTGSGGPIVCRHGDYNRSVRASFSGVSRRVG